MALISTGRSPISHGRHPCEESGSQTRSTKLSPERSSLKHWEELVFGDSFNQPVGGVDWPSSLQRIVFGDRFDHSISGIPWPNSLRGLKLGDSSDNGLGGVQWSGSLHGLMMRRSFNQPMGGSINSCSDSRGNILPTHLRQLTFAEQFKQPVGGVVWPLSLLELDIWNKVRQADQCERTINNHYRPGCRFAFNRPIDGVQLPPSLLTLMLPHEHDQPVRGVQ